MSPLERLFVWAGGAAFVAALACCAAAYLVWWGRVTPFDARALAIDSALFALFALHHSLFARDRVKARLSRVVPDRLLRSFYVWVASALLVAACVLWRPIGGELYHRAGWRAVVHASVQLAGIWIIARSVTAIDPLELAGIRTPSTTGGLQVDGPYGWVRHPLYLGWLLATLGAAHLTGDRLAFAAISTAYLIVAMPWEERSLERQFGAAYVEYARRVRWRLVPYLY